MPKVFVQLWEESERGWGARPDGFSLHLSQDHRDKYIKEYWDGMPPSAPDEYSRPLGNPYTVTLRGDSQLYKTLAKSKCGFRDYGQPPKKAQT